MRVTRLHRNIGIGFAMVWLMMTVVITLALLRMEEFSEDLNAIANKHNIKIGIAIEMRDIIYQRQLLMRNALLYGDVFDREASAARLAILAQQFVTLKDALLKIEPIRGESDLISILDSEIGVANRKGRQLIELMVFHGLTGKTRGLLRDVTDGQNRVIRQLNELVAFETNEIGLAVQHSQETQAQIVWILVVLGGVTSGLIFMVALLVIRHSRSQTEKIEQLARFASENPRPVMRISREGELIYANHASDDFLHQWETGVGHRVPGEWRKLVDSVVRGQEIVEQEIAVGDQVYSVVMTPVENGKYVNVYGHDITEREEIRREFAHLASHDSLTGLINRREFEHVLEDLISDAATELSEHAFMYFDLDQFKVVNDTCGHVAGDELLRQLSTLLKQNIRGSDRLGRLGGDEFGLLLRSCSMPQAEKIAENLRKVIEDFRFTWKDQTFNVGASIGMVSITADSGSLTSVLGAADTACYIAKDSGRNRVHVSFPGDEQLLQRRGQMEWVQRIRDAIQFDRFEMFCQSIYRLGESEDVASHGELLLRYFDEHGGMVPTSNFILAAERYDLMTSIDRWVVSRALPLIAGQLEAGNRAGSWYSINLSGQSLGDNELLGFVLEQLDQSGVPPSAVCFEITETAAISNLSKAIDFISAVRGRGCRIALDDFGSGLSSFNYLRNLKVDYLKIDGAIVCDMHQNPVSAAMVEAITRVAHEMEIEVVAEWVEHPEILDQLRELGVEFAQGYVFGEVLPINSEGLPETASQ